MTLLGFLLGLAFVLVFFASQTEDAESRRFLLALVIAMIICWVVLWGVELPYVRFRPA